MVKKSKVIVSVITADIINSRGYSPALRRRVDTSLKRSFADLAKRYPKAIHTRLAFRITAGDEFQYVISDISKTFDLLMYLRASVATSGVNPLVSFRAGIGVGGISVGKRSNPYEEDGEAFFRAREALEQLKKRKRLTILITEKPEIDRAVDLVLLFLDRSQENWTLPQWEAFKWSLLGLTREEVSQKLNIAHQNVTKRLTAAGWQEFKEASQFLREELEMLSKS